MDVQLKLGLRKFHFCKVFKTTLSLGRISILLENPLHAIVPVSSKNIAVQKNFTFTTDIQNVQKKHNSRIKSPSQYYLISGSSISRFKGHKVVESPGLFDVNMRQKHKSA